MGQAAQREATVGVLVSLARLLRRAGVPVGPDRTALAAEAVACVDSRRRTELYWALRSSLISRIEDADAFDSAFATLFERLPPAHQESPAPAPSVESDAGDAAGTSAMSAVQEAGASERGDAEESDETEQGGAAWSPVERLRTLDFADYGPEELARASALMVHLARSIPLRRSRRMRPGPGGRRIDRRRVLRESIRTAGEAAELFNQDRMRVPRPIAFAVDISGSMQPYARPMVMFLHALRRVSPRVEAFAFGTRLTRLTPELAQRDPDRALAAVAEIVPDWAGGTRIGESLRELRLRRDGRFALRGAILVIVSDGWERGDVALLADEMERLSRASRAIVWVNPLAGEPGYEPLAAGMAAALEHADEFLAGRNLADLEALSEAIERSAGLGRSARPRPLTRRAAAHSATRDSTSTAGRAVV